MTCFFDPTHGYGTEQVMWTPPWGVARAIPVCGSCGHRVRAEQPGAAGHGQAYGHHGQAHGHHGAYAPPPPPPPPAHGYPPAAAHAGHGYPPPPPPAHYPPPPPAAHYPPPPPAHYGHHGHHGHHGRHGYRHHGHGYRHGGVGVGGVIAAGAAGLVAGAVLEDMFDDD